MTDNQPSTENTTTPITAEAVERATRAAAHALSIKNRLEHKAISAREMQIAAERKRDAPVLRRVLTDERLAELKDDADKAEALVQRALEEWLPLHQEAERMQLAYSLQVPDDVRNKTPGGRGLDALLSGGSPETEARSKKAGDSPDPGEARPSAAETSADAHARTPDTDYREHAKIALNWAKENKPAAIAIGAALGLGALVLARTRRKGFPYDCIVVPPTVKF